MKKIVFILTSLCALAMNAAGIKGTDVSGIDNTIYGLDATIDGEGTAVMSVCMKNNFEVPGFQFDIVVPDGFDVPADPDGFFYIELSTARTSPRKTNVFESARMKDGTIRVLAQSTSLATFSGTDGEVCTIKFITTGNVAPGDYEVTLKNIVITDVTGYHTVKPDPTTAILTVPTSTGAELIGADALEGAVIFGADGMRRAGLQPGVNIVHYLNGVTKKVMVK